MLEIEQFRKPSHRYCAILKVFGDDTSSVEMSLTFVLLYSKMSCSKRRMSFDVMLVDEVAPCWTTDEFMATGQWLTRIYRRYIHPNPLYNDPIKWLSAEIARLYNKQSIPTGVVKCNRPVTDSSVVIIWKNLKNKT